MTEEIPGRKRVTLGADKNYDTHDFVREIRGRRVTPHVAQNNTPAAAPSINAPRGIRVTPSANASAS
jgi:hypothetical protein